MEQRRLVFMVLLACAGLSLLLGVFPGLGIFLQIHVGVDVVLACYIGYLVYTKPSASQPSRASSVGSSRVSSSSSRTDFFGAPIIDTVRSFSSPGELFDAGSTEESVRLAPAGARLFDARSAEDAGRSAPRVQLFDASSSVESVRRAGSVEPGRRAPADPVRSHLAEVEPFDPVSSVAEFPRPLSAQGAAQKQASSKGSSARGAPSWAAVTRSGVARNGSSRDALSRAGAARPAPGRVAPPLAPSRATMSLEAGELFLFEADDEAEPYLRQASQF